MADKDVKISVIICAYNEQKHINKAIDSILGQTFTDYEIIIVNDGSTDLTGKIADDYAAKNAKVRVVHQINQGLTCARKAGVVAADSEWIVFLDADDTMCADGLENLYRPVKEGADTNMVLALEYCDFNRTYIPVEEYRDRTIKQRIRIEMWSRMIRRGLFNDYVFDMPRIITKCEDWLKNIRLAFLNDKNVYIVNNKVYNHFTNNDGCIQNFKTSLEFEDIQYAEKLKSVPVELHDKYADNFLWYRFQSIFCLMYDNGYGISRKEIINHPFYINLMKDVEKYSYKMSFENRIILSPFKFEIARFYYVILKFAKGIARRFLWIFKLGRYKRTGV